MARYGKITKKTAMEASGGKGNLGLSGRKVASQNVISSFKFTCSGVRVLGTA